MNSKRQRQKTDKLQFSLSAMIDVTFLLLIYFVVTYQPNVPEAHLTVAIPQGGVAGNASFLRLQVYPDSYAVNQRVISLPKLEKLVRKMADIDPEMTVVVMVDQRAKAQQVVNILDICEDAKLAKLNIVAMR